jgi:hypothetical protein
LPGRRIELDSAGVYLGITPEEFGVQVPTRRPLHPISETRSMAPRQQLQESIDHIREELASGEPLSSEDRKLLENVLGEVSGVIQSDQTEHSLAEEFFDDLREMGERFEESHPKLSIVIGRIADALSQLGI